MKAKELMKADDSTPGALALTPTETEAQKPKKKDTSPTENLCNCKAMRPRYNTTMDWFDCAAGHQCT
jgi:hypothetical protein